MARIVFDLDGTLVDSAPDLQGIANELLAREGRSAVTLAETRTFIGAGVPAFVARMRAARDLPDTAQHRLVAAFLDRYADAVHLTEPFPGAVAALDALAAEGHALGICTNKPVAPCRALLAHLGLADRFAAVLGGDSLATRKPDPAPLLAAFAGLPGAEPRIYVGDSEVDAETGARADVPFLLFAGGYRDTALTELPHAAAFTKWDDLPGLIAAHA